MDPAQQIKTMLEDALRKKKEAKDAADFKEVAGSLVKEIAGSISPDEVSNAVVDKISAAIEPVLTKLLEKDRATSADIVAAINAIELKVPEITVPQGAAPIVNLPAPIVHVPAPIVNIPATEYPAFPDFPESMRIAGFDGKFMPVLMVDQAGKPINLPMGGGGGAIGGRGDFFTIKDIQNSSGGSVFDNDGAMRVSGSFSVTASNSSTQSIDSSGNAYSQANPFPVIVVGGAANTSVSLVNSNGDYYNSDNPLPVSFSASGTTIVQQLSGATDSVNVVTFNGNAPATGLNETTLGVLRTIQMSDNVNSANVVSFNGATPATGLNETTVGVLRVAIMTDVVASVNVVSFNGNTPATGLNETTVGVLRTVQMTDSNSSVNVTTFNGSAPATGLNETTAGVLRIVLMSDTAVSSQAKIIARTTNPTAISNGSAGFQSADKLGRALSRPIQVRELTKTAYVTTTTGVETTLFTPTAGTFGDLIMITATNNSTAAVAVDIREATAGNIIHTMYIPATTGPIGWAPAVPWPQSSSGNNWTVDVQGSDVSNTTVNFTALFSQET